MMKKKQTFILHNTHLVFNIISFPVTAVNSVVYINYIDRIYTENFKSTISQIYVSGYKLTDLAACS